MNIDEKRGKNGVFWEWHEKRNCLIINSFGNWGIVSSWTRTDTKNVPVHAMGCEKPQQKRDVMIANSLKLRGLREKKGTT